jgi:preprotein translocase subunit SecB
VQKICKEIDFNSQYEPTVYEKKILIKHNWHMSSAQTKSNKHGFPKATKLGKRVQFDSQKLHFATKVTHKGVFCGLFLVPNFHT